MAPDITERLKASA